MFSLTVATAVFAACTPTHPVYSTQCDQCFSTVVQASVSGCTADCSTDAECGADFFCRQPLRNGECGQGVCLERGGHQARCMASNGALCFAAAQETVVKCRAGMECHFPGRTYGYCRVQCDGAKSFSACGSCFADRAEARSHGCNECFSNSDCQNGELCADNQCSASVGAAVAAGHRVPCGNDSACGADFFCRQDLVNGVCQAGSCRARGAEGARCMQENGAQCLNPSLGVVKCGAGLRCHQPGRSYGTCRKA